MGNHEQSIRDQLRVPADPDKGLEFLRAMSPADTHSAPGGKEKTTKSLVADGERLAGLQERLYAAAVGGDNRRILLVLQGMDTSGKGGVIRHVAGLVNPQGLAMHSFKAPTAEEREHNFLWRVRKVLPPAGSIGIFDRSHYEDVLIVRVHDLVPEAEWQSRYDQINRFESQLAEDGVTIIKCFLHVSYERQRERLLARLDTPEKHWKFNPSDITERRYWPAYQEAYEAAITRCNSDAAPWYVVPADRKWYRNWAIGQLLLETLTELDPKYPTMDFDVAEQRALLGAD